MKKTIDETQFFPLAEEFAAPIAKWQNKKPAKRSALLICCDIEVGRYFIRICENKRAKYPIATCLRGLSDAMIAEPELLGWVKAHVRYAERELKRRNKQANNQEDGQGDS